jgi:hypothetical protein
MATLGPVGMPVFSTESTEKSVGFMVAGSMARSMRLLGSWIVEARAPDVNAVMTRKDFIVGVA